MKFVQFSLLALSPDSQDSEGLVTVTANEQGLHRGQPGKNQPCFLKPFSISAPVCHNSYENSIGLDRSLEDFHKREGISFQLPSKLIFLGSLPCFLSYFSFSDRICQ